MRVWTTESIAIYSRHTLDIHVVCSFHLVLGLTNINHRLRMQLVTSIFTAYNRCIPIGGKSVTSFATVISINRCVLQGALVTKM